MSIDPHALMSRSFDPVRHRYTNRDTILYALGCGLGADPLDAAQLPWVYEGMPGGLKTLPSLVNVLGYTRFWASDPDAGIDWRRLVHAEQAFTLHRPLPSEGEVVGRGRVVALHDKGAARGAIMVQRREVRELATDELLATVTQTVMLRGDGGFAERAGSSVLGEPLAAPHAMPERAPDASCEQVISPRAALLYRLSGDHNPLHADPEVARAAGFERPILHGLATLGTTLHAAIHALLKDDPARVAGMRVRFTAPVFPGETLRTDLWREDGFLSLRATAVQRGKVVLDAGRVDLFN